MKTNALISIALLCAIIMLPSCIASDTNTARDASGAGSANNVDGGSTAPTLSDPAPPSDTLIWEGSERPPESEASGPACLGDISLRAEAISQARRVITDKDTVFFFVIENLSGKRYTTSSAVLEKKQGNDWASVDFEHANLGLISEWKTQSDMLFLRAPLAAGDYRLRLSMRTFDYYGPGNWIEPECEFTVTAYADAPEPRLYPAQLALSTFDESMQSESVSIALKNPILNERSTILEYVVTANDCFNFGESYGIDALLDGKWYSVPFANDMFLAIGYSITPDTAERIRTYSCHPVVACGVLPAGRYRMIKAFDLCDPDAGSESPVTYLATEYASAEFTVEGHLEWIRISAVANTVRRTTSQESSLR
jgi:hypothetical protein